MKNIIIEAIQKMEMKFKKRIDIERTCDVVNKDHGLDNGAIASLVEKMYVEGMLTQKFHDKEPKSYKIEKSQAKDEDSKENQQHDSFLEYLDGVSTHVECLIEPYECQAQMYKLQCLVDDTSNPHSPTQPSANIHCNDMTNDTTNFSRFSAYDPANGTAHDLDTPGVCSMPLIDINKLLEVTGKLADNENNLQEMLREEKIRNRIFKIQSKV